MQPSTMGPPLKLDTNSSTNDKPCRGPLPVGRLPVMGRRHLSNPEFKSMQKELQLALLEMTAMEEAVAIKKKQYTDMWCEEQFEAGFMILAPGTQMPFSPTESNSGSMQPPEPPHPPKARRCSPASSDSGYTKPAKPAHPLEVIDH